MPEISWYRRLEGFVIFLDPLGLARAGYDGRRGGMRHRELQGCRFDRNGVLGAERLDALDLCQDFFSGWGVLEMSTAG